ncbi:hypothetical protein D1007_45945 [Hordeum vulgare]|nr:hypothetical protein D1007_45945 [Hordeum vulgare]
MALLAVDNDNGGQFTTHHILDTLMRGKDLSVVYTNEPVSAERSIQTMEQLLAEDKYQVDVLIHHYHIATRPCERYATFINNPEYSFGTVDTTNNLKAFDVSGLTCQNLVNIRDHYKVRSDDVDLYKSEGVPSPEMIEAELKHFNRCEWDSQVTPMSDNEFTMVFLDVVRHGYNTRSGDIILYLNKLVVVIPELVCHPKAVAVLDMV